MLVSVVCICECICQCNNSWTVWICENTQHVHQDSALH